MPVEIRVPQLSESVFEVTVGRWLKKEGEPVAPGDELVELETDKANQVLTSEQTGVLGQIVRREGETVGVNEVLAVITDSSAAADAPKETASASSPASTEIVPAVLEEVAPAEQENGRRKTPASPIAERIAADKGLDLSQIRGTGAGGKVLKEDVEEHMSQAGRTAAVAPAAQAAAPKSSAPPVVQRAPEPPRPERPKTSAPLPSLSSVGLHEERIVMSRRRQVIAARLKDAQNTAAMLTTFNEVDMSAIMEIRKRRKETFKERHGVGLGFMSFFTKAAIGALKAYPFLNAEVQGNEIVLKHHYDIGIAVGAEEGLVVPVVRDADSKTFADLEREIVELAKRARENRLSISELTGGTFTLTNGGVFGSLLSTPILNAPQVGILGMHKIQERPIALNGEVVIRPMMYLALSYDHRIVDGSEAVRFLVRVKELVEDPETLLLEG